MKEKETWLMQSLKEAERDAKELPSWATKINSAVDEFYGRHDGHDEKGSRQDSLKTKG